VHYRTGSAEVVDVTDPGATPLIAGTPGFAAPPTADPRPETMPGSPPPCRYTETPLNVGVVNGEIYTAAPMPTVQCPDEGTAATALIALAAVNDATTAYNQMVALPPGINPGANLGGLTLTPGTYTAPGGSFLLTGSDLTLNAEGNANAVWVFQMADALTVGAAGAPRSVILTNGAQAGNVFWQVGSAATINGSGGSYVQGALYFPNATLTMSGAGNSGTSRYLLLVAKTLNINTNVTTTSNYSSLPNQYSPVRTATLIQ